MYKNIYYNRRSNKIYVWETWNGESNLVVEDYEDTYYVQCPSDVATHKDIYGNPMRVAVDDNGRKKSKAMKALGVNMAESDIDQDVKFIQHRYKGVDIKPDMSQINIAYADIEIQSSAEFPKPEEAKYPINLITVKSSKTGLVTSFGLGEYTGTNPNINEYHYVASEKEMLLKFTKWFRKQKFDVITGWNVERFDVLYIMNRIVNLFGDDHLEAAFSPIGHVKKSYSGDKWEIAGLAVLDYLELYKNFTFETEESYTLQAIGMKTVNEGKLDLDGAINSIYKTDWNRFVDYNIQDVLLVEKIDKKLQFLTLAYTLAYQALVPIQSIFGSISTIEGYILKYLHENEMVLPDRKTKQFDWWVKEGHYKTKLANGTTYNQNVNPEGLCPEEYVKGGHVEAYPGLYKNVMSFDVESLYPHMIMQYNISPETKVVCLDNTEGLIKSEINHVYYKKEKGVLPAIVESIFKERKFFKNEMFKHKKGTPEYQNLHRLQLVRKILINSMYGVLINEYFHFYDIDNARAITRGGRALIRYLSSSIEDWSKTQAHKAFSKIFPDATPKPLTDKLVTVMDTDSSYLCTDEIKQIYAPDMSSMDFMTAIEPIFIKFFDRILRIKAESNDMPHIIRFKREGKITKQLVLAKKKYIVEMLQKEEDIFDPPEMSATGVEIRRSDTPAFCREWLEEGVKNIFEHLDKEKNYQFIKSVYADFKKQEIDRIASVGSVQEYTKYAQPTEYYLKNGLVFASATPIRNRAAITYNWMIAKNKFPYMSINNGSKLKFIRINKDNITGQDVIAWVGNYPEEFKKYFKVNLDEQFEKTFLSVFNRIWTVLGWCGPEGIQMKRSKLGSMFE